MPTRMGWSVAVFLALAATSAFAIDAREAAVPQHEAVEPGPVPVIVRLRTSNPPAAVEGVPNRRDYEARIAEAQIDFLARIRRYEDPRTHRYRALPYLALEVSAEEVRRLATDPAVVSVYPDRRRQSRLTESVPLIGADTARSNGHTGQGWAVAIVDDGVHTGHPFIASKSVVEACFERSDEEAYCRSGNSAMPPADPALCGDCNHGTHLAGIVAGEPAAGEEFSGIGVAPGAGLVAVATDLWDSSIFAALDFILSLHDHGQANVAAVNFSWGGTDYYRTACDTAPTAQGYVLWVEELASRGIAVVAAAGNERYLGTEASVGIIEPACLSKVVAVGAVNDDDEIAFYSNHNSLIDLLAPGGPITSSVRSSDGSFGYAALIGTSMAVPHVAAGFAVMRAAHPDASVGALLDALKSTGKVVAVDETGTALTPKPRIRIDRAIGAVDEEAGGGRDGGGGTVRPGFVLLLLAALWIPRGRSSGVA